MANEENLHISIGGMLGDDVSRVLCFTTFTNTSAKFDGVATRRQALLESSREDEKWSWRENGKPKIFIQFYCEYFFCIFILSETKWIWKIDCPPTRFCWGKTIRRWQFQRSTQFHLCAPRSPPSKNFWPESSENWFFATLDSDMRIMAKMKLCKIFPLRNILLFARYIVGHNREKKEQEIRMVCGDAWGD